MNDVFIVDGARTPFLKVRLGPGDFSGSDLGVAACRGLLLRQPFSVEAIDELICGSAMPGPDEANVGRVISLRAGCHERTPAWTVQRNCAAGLQAIDSAYQAIQCHRSQLVLAGGAEAMSRAPLLFKNQMATWLASGMACKTMGAKLKHLACFKLSYLSPIIALLRGLTDPFTGLSMGQTTEEIAHLFKITREMMDRYAVQSHKRVIHAQENNYL